GNRDPGVGTSLAGAEDDLGGACESGSSRIGLVDPCVRDWGQVAEWEVFVQLRVSRRHPDPARAADVRVERWRAGRARWVLLVCRAVVEEDSMTQSSSEDSKSEIAVRAT